MAYFNNDNRSGGNRGFDRGNRPAPAMHQATCSNCGKACQVPFRPTGAKPVFCTECFKKQGGPDRNRSDRSDRSDRSERSDRQMFDAVCDNCGDRCQIPFQPREGRPVLCRRCFGKERNQEEAARSDSRPDTRPQYKEQLDALHVKLDKILSILAPVAAPVTQAEKVVEATETAKPAAKKKVVKKKAKTTEKPAETETPATE